MDNDKVKKVCELPIEFKKGIKSTFQLAKESGFENENKNDSIAKIKDYLQSHISLLNSWDLWSKDKRTTEGYYLQLGNKNIVGYLGKNQNIKTLKFKTSIDACSEFIFLEISSILNLTIND